MDRALRSSYLVVSPMGELKSYSRSRHWHCTEAGATGTLEATVAENNDGTLAARLSWHDNRYGPWIHDAVMSLEQLWEETEL